MIHTYDDISFSFEPPLLSSNPNLVEALGEHEAVKSGLDASHGRLFANIHEVSVPKMLSHPDTLVQHLGALTGASVTISYDK